MKFTALCLIPEGSEYHIQPVQRDLVLFQSHKMLALPVPHMVFLILCISPMLGLLDTDKMFPSKKNCGQLFSESVHTNSFAGQVPNGHKTFPITGQIRDRLVSSQW